MPPAADEYVLRHAPGPVLALHPSVVRTRSALRAAMAALHAGVSDADLEFGWGWDGRETDVRYGFYSLYELLEMAAASAELAVGTGAWGAARAPIAAATAARWDLYGLLAGLRDEDLDADPGGGEWTIRQTLAHIIGTQRAYSWHTAWWVGQRQSAQDDYPLGWPKGELDILLAAEADDAAGNVAEMIARLDALMDSGAARLGRLDADELAARARWSGLPVTVRFRLWRWSSHIREHAIQIEKTLAMLRRERTEVERLLRLIAAAYGRLEARVFGVAPEAVERAGSDGSASAAQLLAALASTLDRYARSVPTAAGARVPITEQ